MKKEPILIVNEKELMDNIPLDEVLIEEIEKGFVALSDGKADSAPYHDDSGSPAGW